MRLNITFSAELWALNATPAIAMIEAADGPGTNHIVSSQITFTPDTPSEVIADIYGNPCRRLYMPARLIQVDYAAALDVLDGPAPTVTDADPDLMSLPPEAVLYTLPSRYCPSDELVRMAQDLFGRSRPGLQRVQDVCQWINERVLFAYATSNVSTTAADTATQRMGVCRDFAHLGIAFCRALHIPARYASGYCLGLEPQDLHAYFQAYVGGCWVDFDATCASPRLALAQVAHGRDAADCAWWTAYGSCMTNRMTVNVTEQESVSVSGLAEKSEGPSD